MNKLSSNQFSESVTNMLSDVKEELHKLFQNRLSEVILFGSFARGNYSDESDIDLLAILDEIKNKKSDKEKYFYSMTELSLKYDKVFSLVLFSKDDFQNKKIPLLMNIRREGIIL
jgi:predicted nucleotidyltransferase